MSPLSRTRTEYGSNSSRRSYPRSSTSSDSRSFDVNYTNVHIQSVQYQPRNNPSPRTFQHPESYAVSAPNPHQGLPLTQQNLYGNHTQSVNPITRQQREQQQYDSQVAAARSLGIDPAYTSVARERPQGSRPMEAYVAEPGPRYLSVAPPQDPRYQDRRGTRL